MNTSITSLNTSPTFDAIDPQALKSSLGLINTLVAGINADFIRLNYLQAVNDHARTLQRSINDCEKWPTELAILAQAIDQAKKRLQDAARDLVTLPSETEALNGEIEATLQGLIATAKVQSELQRQRLQAIQQPLPDIQAAIADLTALVPNLEAKRVAMAPKLIAAESDLQTVDDALRVISELKLTDIAEQTLKSITDTIALKELKDPAAIVNKAGDLLKRTLGTVEGSLTYLALLDSQAHFQKSLHTLRADDARWALDLSGMKERLDYLGAVGTLDRQRVAYAEAFSRVPDALGRFVDSLQQPDADLAARLARLRVVCAAFQAFIKPR